MLRDVVIHMHNEQPLRADLLAEPGQGDAVLICRNLRAMNGKKPIFVDHADSTFMIPLVHIRFVEITQVSIEEHAGETVPDTGMTADVAAEGTDTAGAPDRLAWLGDGGGAQPPDVVVAPAGGPGSDGGPDELDEDLLRRIKDA